MASITERLVSAFNVFKNHETKQAETEPLSFNYGGGFSGMRSDRRRPSITNERSIVVSIYTRMAIDAAAVKVRHVRLEKGRYKEDLKTGLNYCLTRVANLDQAATEFRQDYVDTLLQKGAVALVPINTTGDPLEASFEINDMRVGEIVQWYPQHVKVSLYDERDGQRKEIILRKAQTAIVTNPFYTIMNEPNSTLQRLTRKLALLDSIDEQSGSGKLDIIIQLPYVIKSEARKQQAEQRRTDIEMQLKGSKYGIAYTDGTEKITQLNRPAENNLLGQVQYLTEMLFGQLGLTPEILNGTADQATMLNYNNRTIKPILVAVQEAVSRAFISKTGYTQGQAIEFFISAFDLIPLEQVAEIADKLLRNEVMTANEFRGIMGMEPFDDPKANELRNSNMPVAAAPPVSTEPASSTDGAVVTTKEEGDRQNGS